MEKTLILLKPDAVQRNLSGEIIKILEQTGYKIIGMKFMILPLEKANDHYSEHKDKPFFEELLSYITSGPVVAVVIEGNNAVVTTRQMVGATKSFEAEPGSIRGDFG